MINFFNQLDKYLKYKGLNDNKITVETGISNGLIGKARIRGALSQENISKILQKYPELNANWLFTGDGDMLKEVSKGGEVRYSLPEYLNIEQQISQSDNQLDIKDITFLRKENAQLSNTIKDKDDIIDGLKFKVATLEKEIRANEHDVPYILDKKTVLVPELV